MPHLYASTPGRICLFGEHLDYLGLPVIAAAVSLRIGITAEPTPERGFQLYLPDIGEALRIAFDGEALRYVAERDYFRAGVNVLLREGFTFSRGLRGEVRGNIPINSGTSSSSALLVTWLNILTQLADQPQTLAPERLAELAYQAEVLEFGEPGGMMDHYSTAVGGIIYLESQPDIRLEKLNATLGAFVLGDSGEAKDTVGILGRVKHGMIRIVGQLRAIAPAFSLYTTELTTVAEYKDVLSKDDYGLLRGTLHNRDILREALVLLRSAQPDATRLGRLLTEHHAYLRDAQRISTPKIDRMLDAALAAGALGGKINGSGGGGCMFAYAPDNADTVAAAIERAGGRAYVVNVAAGTSAGLTAT